jgi:hypothetical protein
MKKLSSILCFFIGLIFFISCKNEKTNVVPVNCEDNKDIIDALPNLKIYKNFNIQSMDCLPTPNGRLVLFTYKDLLAENSQMTVQLLDLRQSPEFDKLVEMQILNYKNSKLESNILTKPSQLFIGKYTTVTISGGVATFDSYIKDYYNLRILITAKNVVSNFAAVDSFLKDYVQKIDASKLK